MVDFWLKLLLCLSQLRRSGLDLADKIFTSILWFLSVSARFHCTRGVLRRPEQQSAFSIIWNAVDIKNISAYCFWLST
jgi:hypothetical protein